MPQPDGAPTLRRVFINVKTPKSDEEIVRAFLRHAKRPDDEYEKNVHLIHQDPERRGSEAWSFLILDMNVHDVQGCDLHDIHYEIYKARSNELQDEL
ncbi:hypothetical protein A1O3_09441 [Capronia epimyces CBS 606.96]|uniref:Uncharacterized protein n=1 Tax=Capronia epimyces CBS 606.96 TaxID=1182542 RepID=W9XLS4_9EURO|nr:uncharacterized protein A1O3_09441 [Capronia epimyces CBS 606.96]EXJ78280.1 hypothetical protein A1O3_09441 [Capronia epimyces CBS 606.96]